MSELCGRVRISSDTIDLHLICLLVRVSSSCFLFFCFDLVLPRGTPQVTHPGDPAPKTTVVWLLLVSVVDTTFVLSSHFIIFYYTCMAAFMFL